MAKNPVPNAGNKSTGLTDRQRAFCEFYLQSGNVAESARKAGYAEKSAGSTGNYLVTKNPNVKNYLLTRRKKLQESRMAKTDEIVEYLTAVMRGEHDDEQLMNIGIGDGRTCAEKHTLRVASKERLKAAEMLARIHGMFIAKQEVELSGKIPVVIKDDI